MQKGFSVIVVIVGLLIVTAGAGIIFSNNPRLDSYPFPWSKQNSTNPQESLNIPNQELLNTYHDRQIGFEFKYPNNWEVTSIESSEGGLWIVDLYDLSQPANSLPSVTLNIYSNPRNLTFKEYDDGKEYKACPVYYASYDTTLELNSSLQVFYKEKGFCEPLEAKMYVWKNDNYIFQLRSKDEPEKAANQDEIFDQILSTFKFIDSTQSAPSENWKLYNNDVYGFSFNYPNGFSVQNDLPRTYSKAIASKDSLKLKNDQLDINITVYFNFTEFVSCYEGKDYKVGYSSDKGIYAIEEKAFAWEEVGIPERTCLMAPDDGSLEGRRIFILMEHRRDYQEGEKLFKEILSTFRFAN